MTGQIDLTGRTRGAGSLMQFAGKTYVWTVNADGKLETAPLEGLVTSMLEEAQS